MVSKEARLKKHTDYAETKQLNTYLGIVAKDLQSAIRAEAGAFVGNVKCVIDGKIETVWVGLGEVACVTCGKVMPWSHEGTHAGHFLPGRTSSIVLEEIGIHCQCYRCNGVMGGNGGAYRIFMAHMYGLEVIESLERRKRGWRIDIGGREVRLEPWTKWQLVPLRISFIDRRKAAESIIRNGGVSMAKAATPKKRVAKKKSASNGQLVTYQSRQLTLDFDYKEYGLENVAKTLNKLAQNIGKNFNKDRMQTVTVLLSTAKDVAAAKERFKDQKTEGTWAAWCKDMLPFGRSMADRLIQVDKACGTVDVEVLAGLPQAAIFKLSQDAVKPVTRKKIFAAAVGHNLTVADVDELIGRPKLTEERNVNPIPATHEELLEYWRDPVLKCRKRLTGPLQDELPVVLRELAAELESEE